MSFNQVAKFKLVGKRLQHAAVAVHQVELRLCQRLGQRHGHGIDVFEMSPARLQAVFFELLSDIPGSFCASSLDRGTAVHLGQHLGMQISITARESIGHLGEPRRRACIANDIDGRRCDTYNNQQHPFLKQEAGVEVRFFDQTAQSFTKGVEANNGDEEGFDEFLWATRNELATTVGDFALLDYEGNEISMADVSTGKVTLLAFWFPT